MHQVVKRIYIGDTVPVRKDPDVAELIADLNRRLGTDGMFLIRYSGIPYENMLYAEGVREDVCYSCVTDMMSLLKSKGYAREIPEDDVGIEEISPEDIGEFWDLHIKYLEDDGIIQDHEDLEYYSGRQYRGILEAHMVREKDPQHMVWFVLSGMRIGAASYCTYKSEDGKCFILDFWVFPQYRGNGTGHRCYEALERYTKADDAVYYELNSEKPDSIRFWQSLGFEENGRDEYGMKLFIKTEKRPPVLRLYEPEISDLWFRKKMLEDEETMSYNHAWGGTIPFPEEEWQDWYGYWIKDTEGRRFYRYLVKDDGDFVGEIAYHLDRGTDDCMADIIIYSPYRGRGYGDMGLDMLCDAARENGMPSICDDIAIDNPAVSMFLTHGFSMEYRTDDIIYLRKKL